MKRIKNLCSTLLLGVLCVLFLCSCGETEDKNHPLMLKASEERARGNHEVAAMTYKKFLNTRPNSAMGNLQLASLYDENLNRPLQAIYHYQEFLRLNPNSTESESVKIWLQNAEKKYYFQLRDEFNDPEDVENLQNSIRQTSQSNADLQKENRLLRGQIKVSLNQYKNIKKELEAKEQKIAADTAKIRDLEYNLNEQKRLAANAALLSAAATENLPPKSTADNSTALPVQLPTAESANTSNAVPQTPTPNPANNTNTVTIPEPTILFPAPPAEITTPAVAVVLSNEPENTIKQDNPQIPTTPPAAPLNTAGSSDTVTEKVAVQPESDVTYYQVKSGDTLGKISRRFYGNSMKFKIILDANSDILRSEHELQIGQILKIPAKPNSR